MKRYNVTIERTYIVYAEDESLAKQVALGILQSKDVKVTAVSELPPLESEAKNPEVERWCR